MTPPSSGDDPSTAHTRIREAGRRVLKIESDALAVMADDLPADFAPAVQKIIQCSGRVIVSGIGKSGHIGRKIAATLASTGTPSFFVHFSEASHGDLGMVGEKDVCILISNSGTTAEMHDMIYHTRRFSIPMIGISSNPDSFLMQAADFKLTLPNCAEACSIGMAPTTSTTMTLALGDALAVALMDQRGFRAEDFSVYHPGGKLGAQLRRVGELMHSGDDIPVVSQDAPMGDVLLAMTSKGFGISVVLDGGKVSGVITDGDLRRNMEGLMDRTASQIAHPDPITVTPDCLAPEALAILNSHKISVLMVVNDDNEPVGVLHIHDLLRAGVG